MREEVTGMLEQIKEENAQTATEMMTADQAKFNESRNTAVLALIIAILVGLALTVLLTRMIARPINTLVEHAHLMAQGDFTHDVPEILHSRRDEMGMLANAFAEMNGRIRDMLKEVSVSVQEPAHPARNSPLPQKKSLPREKALIPRSSRLPQEWKKLVLL